MAPTADADPYKTDAVTRKKERRLLLSKQFDEIDNEMETLTDKMASKKKKRQKPRPVNSVGTETGPSLSPVKQQTERTGALFSPGGHATPANILSSQVLQLYSSAADSDLVASCLYCSDATFTDPLVSVSGFSHIQAKFRFMRLLLRGSDIEMHHCSLRGDPDWPADDDTGALFVSFTVVFYLRLVPTWLWAPSLHINSIQTGM